MSIDIERKSEGPRDAPDEEVLEGLNDLLQLDHDAVGSYEIAIEKLQNPEHAAQIAAFQRDHERHIRELNDVIVGLGGSPLNEPHSTAPLKQAVQQIAAAGGDEAILMAWRTNELQVTTKYDSYAHKALWWPDEAKRVVDQNALDEEKHYRWVTGILGASDPKEIHAANRAREEMARARLLGREAQDWAGELAQRLSEGVQAAKSRLAGEGQGGGEIDVRARLEEEIRANPVRSLAVVFGVAFILGRIIR